MWCLNLSPSQQEPEEEEYLVQDVEEAPAIKEKKVEEKKKEPEKIIPKKEPEPEPVKEIVEPKPEPKPQPNPKSDVQSKEYNHNPGGTGRPDRAVGRPGAT